MQKDIIVHMLILNDQGKILILQRSKQDDVLPEYWDIPGGTLEDGEDPANGAIKETKEETGLDVSNVKLFFQKSNIDTSKNKQFVTLVFHTKCLNANVVLNPDEHEKCVWVKSSEISSYKTVEYLHDCLVAYGELKY